MGFGDDLLITNKAAEIKKLYPDRQIVIGSVSNKNAYHSIIYNNNPNISDCNNLDFKKPIHIIDYHPGNRPYIDYKKSTNTRYVWNKSFKPTPGQLFFTKKEISDAEYLLERAKEFWKKKYKHNFKNIIFLETSSTKINDKQFGIKQQNKDWGIGNWSNLVKSIKDEYLIIHSTHEKTTKIDDIYYTEKINFRTACAVLNYCDLYLGPEGGFGHAAAALRKKAVIYFGGWISPDVIGYDFHHNLYFNHEESPCGEYKKICKHCEMAREKITIDTFRTYINKAL